MAERIELRPQPRPGLPENHQRRLNAAYRTLRIFTDTHIFDPSYERHQNQDGHPHDGVFHEEGTDVRKIGEGDDTVLYTILQPVRYIVDRRIAAETGREKPVLRKIASAVHGKFNHESKKYVQRIQKSVDCAFETIYSIQSQYDKGKFSVSDSNVDRNKRIEKAKVKAGIAKVARTITERQKARRQELDEKIRKSYRVAQGIQGGEWVEEYMFIRSYEKDEKLREKQEELDYLNFVNNRASSFMLHLGPQRIESVLPSNLGPNKKEYDWRSHNITLLFQLLADSNIHGQNLWISGRDINTFLNDDTNVGEEGYIDPKTAVNSIQKMIDKLHRDKVVNRGFRLETRAQGKSFSNRKFRLVVE